MKNFKMTDNFVLQLMLILKTRRNKKDKNLGSHGLSYVRFKM